MANKKKGVVLIQINDKTWIETKSTDNHEKIKDKWLKKLGDSMTLGKIAPMMDHAALKREQRRKKKELNNQ